MSTPHTPDGLKKFDHLSPVEAVRRAWADEGRVPWWHRFHRRDLHNRMPLLARALDRLEKDTR